MTASSIHDADTVMLCGTETLTFPTSFRAKRSFLELKASHVATLLARGARHLWDQPRWTVLADPEGNEFCVFPPS